MESTTAKTTEKPVALIVDDDNTTCATMTAALRKSGFDVKHAADGASGIILFDVVNPDLIFLDVPGNNRENVLKNIVAALAEKSDAIKDPEIFYREVLEREKLGSTGIGEGVAIPHARTDAVRALVLTFARTAEPIDFAAEDKQPVRLIFLLAVPVRGLKSYLMTLARISRVVRKASVRQQLLEASDARQIIQIIHKAETAVDA